MENEKPASRREAIYDNCPMSVNLRNISEKKRIISGVHKICGSLYDCVGFGLFMRGCPVSLDIFKDIVIGRLARPLSKKATADFPRQFQSQN